MSDRFEFLFSSGQPRLAGPFDNSEYMDENPYKSPAHDFMAELRIKRRRRKLINFALTLGLCIVLFAAYWGIKALFVVLNSWLLGPR